MNALLHLLKLNFLPASTDLALLILRVWLGLSMLLLHGWGKLMKFSATAEVFPDPIGIGGTASLGLAVLAEVFASGALVIGLFSRLSALGGLITMAVAFFIHHHAILSGDRNGELAFIYLAGYVTLFVAGPGRFSVDRLLR